MPEANEKPKITKFKRKAFYPDTNLPKKKKPTIILPTMRYNNKESVVLFSLLYSYIVIHLH